MPANPIITFIGAGSTVFMKNIVGDVLQRPALSGAEVRLMDIDPKRLADSEVVAGKIASTLKVAATVKTYTDQRAALDGADFVVVAFQIGGYEPATVTDFEIPKQFGLRQTIADTLGIGGIMRGLRTVPHLWKICADMMEVCPEAILLQYVNPMAINTWAISAKYPAIRQVGLCHSVQGTAEELAHDLDIPIEKIRYRSAGINHMAFYLNFEEIMPDGSYRDLYPDLRRGYAEGRFPKPNTHNPRCPNKVRYEVLTRLGYFVTESSEHFAEYVPVVHQARPPRSHREVRHPARRIPAALHRQHRQVAEAGQGIPRRADHHRQVQPRIRLRDHELGLDRHAVGHLRQRPEPRPHHLAARGLRRRGALPRRPQRHPADRASASCRRSSPA